MTRIKLDTSNRFIGMDDQIIVTNISGDFLGILAKINNDYLFNGQDWIVNAETKPGERIKSSLIFEDRPKEYCLEKINMLVEKYINRFFEKEE